ncbi:GNAT family N-acetyltransferase [Halorussus marinus]|uniref:GNAT family N-acetyltransferase n=1 Tax=Halorussus marinus TaxID=2505976 RepID=UPI00106E6EF8|nr:GNAT family N-acetyltransferase [Halorussus marinus]
MIRTAVAADEPRLRELQGHLREPNPPLLSYAIDGPPITLVSVADGEPAGYLVAFHDGEAGYVAELVVAPARRREGRARRLLAGAFDALRAAGCSRVRLAVHPENDAGSALYESMGFEEVGRDPAFYADGSDARVLGRRL